jgi:hypothetical protein
MARAGDAAPGAAGRRVVHADAGGGRRARPVPGSPAGHRPGETVRAQPRFGDGQGVALPYLDVDGCGARVRVSGRLPGVQRRGGGHARRNAARGLWL